MIVNDILILTEYQRYKEVGEALYLKTYGDKDICKHLFEVNDFYDVLRLSRIASEKLLDLGMFKFQHHFGPLRRSILPIHSLTVRHSGENCATLLIKDAKENIIPLLISIIIALRFGYNLELNVSKTSTGRRTGADIFSRLISRIIFSGTCASKDIIVIDDHVFTGGTMQSLVCFLNGKKVNVISPVTISAHPRFISLYPIMFHSFNANEFIRDKCRLTHIESVLELAHLDLSQLTIIELSLLDQELKNIDDVVGTFESKRAMPYRRKCDINPWPIFTESEYHLSLKSAGKTFELTLVADFTGNPKNA